MSATVVSVVDAFIAIAAVSSDAVGRRYLHYNYIVSRGVIGGVVLHLWRRERRLQVTAPAASPATPPAGMSVQGTAATSVVIVIVEEKEKDKEEEEEEEDEEKRGGRNPQNALAPGIHRRK